MRPKDERYFEALEADLDDAFAVAREAKAEGGDPEPEVEIPLAQDMADRVENILGIDGVAERVRELEGEMSREEAALELAEDFAEGRVGDYATRAGKVEGAVRTAVALLTEGVVAAPIEGIDKVEVLENDDGTEFVNVYYAGPIRSAGGTAQALSVLVADYARTLIGIDEYGARDDEVERYAEEVTLYDKETGLQYSPKDAETTFIAEHMPIMLDGEATGDEEVSGFRDLERVDTNNPRGGMCLVLAEGIALKAPKIQRYTRNLDEVDWPWLQDLIDGTVGEDDGEEGEADGGADDEGSDAAAAGGAVDAHGPADAGDAPVDGPPRADPNGKFLRDLIAGRPVFGHPSESGGFRLRYGRARNHGHATAGVHPATMHLVDDFLATGTQIKTERPGKAAGVVPVDSIEGPTVRLANGEVRRLDDAEEALELRNGVEKILDLGEYLVNYGEFVENNHPLAPASYATEWWVQDFEAAGADVQALRDAPNVDLDDPSPREAVTWATEYDAPLHPKYTYLWHDVSVERFEALAEAVARGEVVDDGDDDALVVAFTETTRDTLEALLVHHSQGDDEIRVPEWRPLARSLGIAVDGADAGTLRRTWDDLPERAREWGEDEPGDNAVKAVNEVAPFAVRERAPTRIGNRMGRPEKSEERELSPAVHTLFPIGEAGGSQRDVAAAATHADDMSSTPGEVEVEVGRRECADCGEHTFECECPACGGNTFPHFTCPECDSVVDLDGSDRAICDDCEVEATPVERRTVDVNEQFRSALEAVGERENAFDTLKGVKGLSSSYKTPEPIEKGVLRAKHGVSAFKDGTVRYDMTDLPVTAVRPAELDVTADHFRSLGYEEDVHGDPLEHDDQLVELKVQDVVLSDGAADHMLDTADFVDDLLESYYGLEPFYELEEREDLVGELVFGMAPHTSAAVVGRIVGFTSAAVGYAHPYFHAAKRRNCFHPETKVWYEDESGKWHYDEIRPLVEKRLDDPRQDDFGALVEELDGDVWVPSVDEDGEVVQKPVEAVSKHPAADHLVEIGTRSGREITVTPDHPVLVWTGDGVERIDSREVQPGDELPARPDRPNPSDTASSPEVAADGGALKPDEVASVEIVGSDTDYTYSITVGDTHSLVANGLYTANCDGDEDCVMLLMDGLLNFSKEFLPDKRGGSVAEDSRLVAFDPDGNLRFVTFDEFWNELESEVERDGKFRKKTCLHEGWMTYAFDDEHRASPKPIEKAIRYRADEDEELLKVESQFGRHIEITGNHSLFRYDDGIEEVAGENLEEGDLILAPRDLGVEPEETEIDVANYVENPYVFIDDEVEQILRDVWEDAEWGSERRAAFDGGLSYRLSKSKLSFETFEQIIQGRQEQIPTDGRIGIKGSSVGITRTVEVDEDFAWLLGIFVAEGSLSGSQPTIHNSEDAIVDEVVETATDVFDCEPSVRWSNKSYEVAFPAVLREVLYELGFENSDSYESSEKIIPDAILRSPREIVLSFIEGFLAGDGSHSNDDNYSSIRFHTTSEAVKDGFVFLLHRLGLVANVSRRERDETRQHIYTVVVSGGAEDNPLKQILEGDDPYLPKSLVVTIPDALMEIRRMDITGVKQLVPKYLKRRDNISLEKLREIVTKLDSWELPDEADERLEEIRPLVDGDLSYLRVKNIERVEYDGYLYDLQVGGEPIFTANWLYAHNSMDAPLVMSSRIDPSEIDDEAHNVDVMDEYPREFFEATREMADPGEVEDAMTIVEERLGTDREYADFHHTHEVSDVAMGPDLSAYKTLESMMDKMDAQLDLSRKLRSVDETDVAERVIEYHFLPDLIGNLRAFSRQETRCLDCGETYRRMPLTRDCRECGGDVNLTVHEGSVNKYMETALQVAEQYDCREYTKQRLEIMDRRLESIFENDKNKQGSIADFM